MTSAPFLRQAGLADKVDGVILSYEVDAVRGRPQFGYVCGRLVDRPQDGTPAELVKRLESAAYDQVLSGAPWGNASRTPGWTDASIRPAQVSEGAGPARRQPEPRSRLTPVRCPDGFGWGTRL